MTTNKRKIFVTESMSEQGRALLRQRDDIELIEFPNMISARDFEAMLKEQAPVHGVALGATRFGGRVEDWRAGLGRSLGSLLSRPFVCECPTISTMPRLQPPPRRTQHADFSHCALPFASRQGL